MKTPFSISVGLSLLLLTAVAPVRAISSRAGASEDLGIGFALGQPLGATAKYWITSTTAVDAMAGYHFNSNFDLHADYLFHSFSSFDVASGRLPIYAGLGARVLLGNDSQLGMRIPVGISYLFPTDPLEAFVELAPVVRLVPKIGTDVDGMVGIRLYVNYLK